MPLSGPKPRLTELQPMVWAFIPHRVEGERLMADCYDTAQTKSELAEAFLQLGLPWVWQPITSTGLPDAIEQVIQCRKRREVLVFNFCDGAEPDGYPGDAVIDALEQAVLPFTGARSSYYRLSTSKIEMKERFLRAQVQTPRFAVLPAAGPVTGVCARVGETVIVKPAVSAGSYGIGLRSVVSSDAEVAAQRDELRQGKFARYFGRTPIIAERFIEGPEFTVLVMGESSGSAALECLPPVERVFHRALPERERFLSFDRYWGYYEEESRLSPEEPFYRYELAAGDIAPALVVLARDAYRAVDGSGYGRVDLRLDSRTGELWVLEVNANCGLSSDLESTVGNILHLTGLRYPDLLATIAEGALSRSCAPGGAAIIAERALGEASALAESATAERPMTTARELGRAASVAEELNRSCAIGGRA
jgi:D-alanine-D-alanine ligase